MSLRLDRDSIPTRRFVLPSQDGEPEPAAFILREIRHREWIEIQRVLDETRDEDGRFNFRMPEAYEVVRQTLHAVENVAGPDGEPFELRRDESGAVLIDDVDLFDPSDVMAAATDVMVSAQLKKVDGGK